MNNEISLTLENKARKILEELTNNFEEFAEKLNLKIKEDLLLKQSFLEEDGYETAENLRFIPVFYVDAEDNRSFFLEEDSANNELNGEEQDDNSYYTPFYTTYSSKYLKEKNVGEELLKSKDFIDSITVKKKGGVYLSIKEFNVYNLIKNYYLDLGYKIEEI